MIRNEIGVWGETYAARWLRDNGYRLLTANYVCRFGEADIIAEKDGKLCIVEVKTRNESTRTRPMEAVDEGKQERLRMAAKSFCAYMKMQKEIRFDVCEVYVDDSMSAKGINYIENAFR